MRQEKLLRIVLADDDDDDRELFELALEELDGKLEFSHAPNGKELLKLLQEEQTPDVVFLDLNMPLTSGIECLKIIRQNDKLTSLPVIILSTSRAARDIDTCYNLKANYYIVKPFSYVDLSKIIKNIFSEDWRSKLVDLPKNQFVFNSNL